MIAYCLWLLASLGAPAPELVPLVEPRLDELRPEVREQLEEARRAVEKPPGDPGELARAYGRLGRLYVLYELADSAAASLENAVRLDPASWRDAYYLGVVRQEAGDFEAALEAFAAVLSARPGDVPSLVRSAEVLLRLRRLEEAGEAFARASRLAPESASAHYGLARVAAAERRFEEAVAGYRRALELQPHADALYHPLATALRRSGDSQAARAVLERAGDSRPILDDPLMTELLESSVLARTFLVQGDRARRRGLVGPALEAYRRALELDPDDAGVHYNLGTLLGELGRVAEAEVHFRAAARLEPSRADAHYNLAVALRSRGRLEDAAASFEAAAEASPEASREGLEARLELAATHLALGRRDLASRQLQAVVDAPRRDAELTVRLARYQAAMGDRAGALGVLRRAAARWPESEAVRRALEAASGGS